MRNFKDGVNLDHPEDGLAFVLNICVRTGLLVTLSATWFGGELKWTCQLGPAATGTLETSGSPWQCKS